MKSLRGLVVRYIWKNKLRAAMTIVAISISAFVIFTLFSFGLGIGYNKRVNQYERTGPWDAQYRVSKERAEEFLKLKKGEATSLSDDGCKLKDIYVVTVKEDILYIDDTDFFKGASLKYGRYPENEDEIIVSISTLNNSEHFVTPNPTVGHKVEVRSKDTDGNFLEEYTTKLLTGIYNNTIDTMVFTYEEVVDRMYALVSGLAAGQEYYKVYDDLSYYIENLMLSVLDINNLQDGTYKVMVSFDDKEDIEKQAVILGERIGVEPNINAAAVYLYEPDKAGDSYEGAFFTALLMIAAGVFGLVVMVIIRNSFNISVNERENDYGMFRCIGLTRKQIIKMVLLEGFVIGMIGTVIGVVLGCFGTKGLYHAMNNAGPSNLFIKEILAETGPLHFYFIWKALGFTVLFMAVIVGYAMVSPIEKLFRMSPINALRSKDDIDKRVSNKLLKKKRESRTKAGFAGYPVWYGFKNIKVRKGKFYLLVISLSVCLGVVLLVGCVFNTILYTELNTQLKPTITVEGKLDYNDGSNTNSLYDDAYGYAKKLKNDVADKKGFRSFGYASMIICHTVKSADEEVLKKSYGSVRFVGLCERYYDTIRNYVSDMDVSSDEGVRNVILIKGNVKGKDFIPDLKTGDDIDYYGTKLHIAGEQSMDEYNVVAQRELPDLLVASGSNFTFVYLKDFTEPIILEDATEQDKGSVYCSGEVYQYYIYVDLLKDDGSISEYLSNNNYIYTDVSFAKEGMKMMKRVVDFIVAIVLIVIMLNLVNVRSSEILQRRKELRLLKNIGFSGKEIRKSVISEGILVSLYATVVGFILGTGLSYLLTKAIYMGDGMLGYYNPEYMSIDFRVDWTTLTIAAAAVFAINIITSLIALTLVKKDYK